MKCDICGKEGKCGVWDYIIKDKGVGKVSSSTLGVDTVYYENGKEVGREKNKTYSKGEVLVIKGRGSAFICLKCRVIYSALLGIIIPIIITIIFGLFGLIISGKFDISFLINLFEAFLFFSIIFALTPLMKHLILALHLSKKYNIKPFYKIMSKFWE